MIGYAVVGVAAVAALVMSKGGGGGKLGRFSRMRSIRESDREQLDPTGLVVDAFAMRRSFGDPSPSDVSKGVREWLVERDDGEILRVSTRVGYPQAMVDASDASVAREFSELLSRRWASGRHV